MAHWTCGWEAGDLSYYTDAGWTFTTCSIVSTAGRTHDSFGGRGGTYSLQINSNALSPDIGTGGRWLHFWVEDWQTTALDALKVLFRRSGSDNFTVDFSPDGVIRLRLGSEFGTVVAAGGFSPYTAHWIAIEANIANSGQVTVYIDGVQAVQYTGDTQFTANADWDQIEFNPDGGWNTCIDDIIVTTTAEGRLDEHFLPPLIPDGNDSLFGGDRSGSTGGSASYTNVDEIPPDDSTTFNEFLATGTDRYTTGNLGYTPASIHSVTVMNQSAIGDGTTLTQAQTVCATDTGGGGVTEALGTADTLGAEGVYLPHQDTFNTDPDTGSAWTSSGLDDLRIGVKFS